MAAQHSEIHGASAHSSATYESWRKLQDLKGGEGIQVDGSSLDLATVVAVSRYGCANTGFGGSADSRTKHVNSLQRALLQHVQSGILVQVDTENDITSNEDLGFHSMPTSWVMGTMLVRCNSLVWGHSAVSLEVIETILKILRCGFAPVIPLRGSISASGDLMPLAYIGGVVEGSPDVRVRTGKGPTRRIVSAKEALEMAGAEPIELGPKEGLGLINGTAASASVASLALYDTNMLAVFSQILTALAVEALLGNAESFHPFFAEVRPNIGQVEAASNIRSFLRGSKLAQGLKDDKARKIPGLVQDRYPVRTASQWVGPQLEDLLLADRQITTELNSTTDNPLIDTKAGEVYSGGNFQAASTTSAMEKTRLSLQMLGKMLFGQYSELINSSHSNGLPANLTADDPSLSFTMKGVDVNLASYMSELAFLANPVSSHVQSAEMHNQAINSLALIAARYTLQAVELASLICASCLYVGCQALDLRVMRLKFLDTVQPRVQIITSTVFGQLLDHQELEKLQDDLWMHIPKTWSKTTTLDHLEGFQVVVDTSVGLVTGRIAESKAGDMPSIALITTWRFQTLSALNETYES
ncbi:MAG: hypothetical protein Q9226_007668, partial [Calogaya cf. arnoldii]